MTGVLERVWKRIQQAFEIERRIKDVDEWDGAASNYDTTEQYCSACLIDVNAAAGRDEKAQSHCMLPVREPGDSADTFVRQAVHAAAGGHGLSRVKRPDDVPQEDWDNAVKAAANKLISAYNEMDEVAPDAIYELAGKEPPERAIAWSNIFEQVMCAMDSDPAFAGQWPWINDLYQEDEQTVAIVSAGGKLYRTPVMINGGTVELGTAQEVEINFTPTRERAFTIIRQADGTHRWFAITETAVLLRVGEIDSRALFDSFITHAEETGEYPKLRFYHDARLDFGQADWLMREDNCYLASGTFDEEHPVARAFIDALESDRGVWGTSNGFKPTAEPEMLCVAEGVTIPVYTAGVHREISVLPESEAASWFTAITARGVMRMRGKVKDALVTLFGDEAAASAFITQVDETNREIVDRGLITRDGQDGATTEDNNPESGEDSAPAGTPAMTTEEREIVLDEATMEEITARVVGTFEAHFVELRGAIEAARGAIEALPKPQPADFGPVLTRCKRIEDRLETLERTEDEKRREWQADRPARQLLTVTHRPREAAQPEAQADGKPDYERVANTTLANLPAR